MQNDYEKALAILREFGWHKGGASNESGEVCAMRAVHLARGLNWGTWDDDILDEIVEEQYPERTGTFAHHTVVAFNDDGRTTFADVERVFEKAAVRASEIV